MQLSKLIIPKNKGESKCVFFGGKGGVGKTSVAAATAIWLAKKGYKTLIVTTDPASTLSDVFEQKIGHRIRPIRGVSNLYGLEINSKIAAEEYKNRILGPIRSLYPADLIKTFEDQLDSPCAEEMAAFDKFIDYVEEGSYDVIVFDTAPAGHTLRLLELPTAWSKYLEKTASVGGMTCIGPAQSLVEYKERYDRAIKTLSDLTKTVFIFVLNPEATPILETERAVSELNSLGIHTSGLVVNMVLDREICEQVPFFMKRYEMQQKYIRMIYEKFNNKDTTEAPLFDSEIKGLNILSKLAEILYK